MLHSYLQHRRFLPRSDTTLAIILIVAIVIVTVVVAFPASICITVVVVVVVKVVAAAVLDGLSSHKPTKDSLQDDNFKRDLDNDREKRVVVVVAVAAVYSHQLGCASIQPGLLFVLFGLVIAQDSFLLQSRHEDDGWHIDRYMYVCMYVCMRRGTERTWMRN